MLNTKQSVLYGKRTRTQILSVLIAFASASSVTSVARPQRQSAITETGTFTAAAIQTAQTTQPLTIGVPAERELIPGDVHSYSILASVGQFFRVVVMQDGIDVTVRLKGPNGKQILEVDSPSGRNGHESVSAIAELTGIFELEVAALDKNAAPGRYQITLETLRLPSAMDRDRLFVDRTLSEAEGFHAKETKESLHKALALYELALPILRTLGDHWKVAETLHVSGRAYYLLGEMIKARNKFSQAQEQWRLTAHRAARIHESYTLSSLALTYRATGEPEKAIQYREQALALSREANDRLSEAFILRDLGEEYILSDRHKALKYLNEALTTAREMQYRRLQSTLLSHLGSLFSRYGEPREALDYFNQALQIQRTTGVQWEEALALSGMARAYLDLGELQEALKYYNESLGKQRAIGNRIGESGTLAAIGYVYLSLSEPTPALRHFQESLSVARALQNKSAESYALLWIARAHRSVGEHEKALENLKAAQALSRTSGSKANEGSVQAQIGIIYSMMGKREDAVTNLQQALRLQRSAQDANGEAHTLSELGEIETSFGRIDEAVGSLRAALLLQRAGGDKWGEATTLYRLAKANSIAGHLEAAREDIEAAVSVFEHIRNRLVGDQLRTSLSASRQHYYELHLEILMAMHRQAPTAGYDRIAYQTSERARARALLEILIESRVDIRAGIDPELVARERNAQQRLNAKADWLVRLLNEKHSREQEADARREVDDLVSNYRQVLAEIRAKSPAYAGLTQPEPFSSKEIQKELDQNTILLEYALGEERSYLFAVTPTSVRSYELPGRAEIEKSARNAYEVLVKKADALDPEVLRRLSQLVLGPVANDLGNKRLLIVSQGALQYVPFAVLPDPMARHEPGKGPAQPLLASHEVINLPSASVLVLQRRELRQKPGASKKLIVFADPVFDQSDNRVRRNHRAPAEVSPSPEDLSKPTLTDYERSAGDLGLTEFPRLTLSRKEADLITDSIAKGRFLKVLDFAANHQLATSSQVSEYQIVHFATHSLLNNQHPELSGVVLSLVDEQGRPANGFLRLNEVYNLRLNADMVVLSACQTALGKDIKGEGLVGLTRGFMYAGTPRVVASLWKVSDSATADLMKRFYENMLVKGMRPAEAFRIAQVSLSKEKQWAAPYYWAGFVFQGEWR